MRKVLLAFIVIMFAGLADVYPQKVKNDPELMRIGNRSISRSEFEAVYRKNNIDMQVADPKSVEEYLELYINFNLKVVEAMSLGLDTNPNFIAELQTYREQLSRPFFDDEEVAEHLVVEAYERMKYDIRGSHILVSLDRAALPADTLKAYNRISEIRSRALAGTPFAELARTQSDDPSARDTPATENSPLRPGNAGDLGYFTVLTMVYPFENAAYSTPVGQISKPFRSDFGYHIVQVNDRIPAMGTARVAHIMLMASHDISQEEENAYKEKMQSIYQEIIDGKDFGELAQKYSEDQNSAARNGEMAPFNSSRMVPEFIKAISELHKPGDVSNPVRTRFGWHIIKLLEKTPPRSFEEEYEGLKTRIARDNRAKLSKQAVVERLKKEYKLQEYPQNLEPFYSLVDETIFKAAWNPVISEELNKVLITFASESYSQKDFGDYLKETQALRAPQDIAFFVNNSFKSYIETRILAYEESVLESKYPAFKNLMREYHDGILLFELTDQLVWTKAMEDTLGLQEYFEGHRDQYFCNERLDASIFTFSADERLSEARELIATHYLHDASMQEIAAQIREELGLSVTTRRGRFEKGENEVADLTSWEKGIYSPLEAAGKYHVVVVHEKLPAQPCELSDVKGLVISDYQNFLEKQWVDELRKKYEVVVDQKVLKSISF